jgi:hypothetical protein
MPVRRILAGALVAEVAQLLALTAAVAADVPKGRMLHSRGPGFGVEYKGVVVSASPRL